MVLRSHGSSPPICHKLEGDESRRVQLLEAQNQAAYYTIGSFLILSNHQGRSKGLPIATALKEGANCSQEAALRKS
jgi:hypothetical protein